MEILAAAESTTPQAREFLTRPVKSDGTAGNCRGTSGPPCRWRFD